MATTPPVAIIMGSQSDWATLKRAADTLETLDLAFATNVTKATLATTMSYLTEDADADGRADVCVEPLAATATPSPTETPVPSPTATPTRAGITAPDTGHGAGEDGSWGPALIAAILALGMATVALAARFDALVAVVIGTTIGMLLANAPVAVFGDALAQRLPVRAVHLIAALTFAALRLAALLFG